MTGDEQNERDALELPEGYYMQVDGHDVRIFHRGHNGESAETPELIFQSGTLHDRRPSFWFCGKLTDEEGKVLNRVLISCWGWRTSFS